MATINNNVKNKIRRQAKTELQSASKQISIGGKIAILLTFIIAVIAGVFAEKLITKNAI